MIIIFKHGKQVYMETVENVFIERQCDFCDFGHKKQKTFDVLINKH